MINDVLTPEQARQLLATCASDSPIDLRDRAMFVIWLETGMRRMSLAKMTFESITRDSGYPITRVPIKGSSGKLYPVPLSDAAMTALEPWRRWLRSQKVTTGPVFRALFRRMNTTGKLVYEVGDGLALVSIYKIVTHRAQQAGLTSVHPHIFRNTFIDWRIKAGISPFQIAAIIGHKIANLPGTGTGAHDTARLGAAARATTPAWLSDLLRKP